MIVEQSTYIVGKDKKPQYRGKHASLAVVETANMIGVITECMETDTDICIVAV